MSGGTDPMGPSPENDQGAAWERRMRAAGMMDVTVYGLTRSPGAPAMVLLLESGDGAVHRFRLPIGEATALADLIIQTAAEQQP